MSSGSLFIKKKDNLHAKNVNDCVFILDDVDWDQPSKKRQVSNHSPISHGDSLILEAR